MEQSKLVVDCAFGYYVGDWPIYTTTPLVRGCIRLLHIIDIDATILPMSALELQQRRAEAVMETGTLRRVGRLPRTLDGYPLDLYQGYDQHLVAQLVEKSVQPHILSSTPKDSQDTVKPNGTVRKARFKSPETFADWYEKGRALYSLVSEEGDVGGVVWFGPEEMKGIEANHTFAIRHYEGYAGKGLGRSFMAYALLDYMLTLRETDQMKDFKGIWLETDEVNEDALGLYYKFGFKQVTTEDGRVTMVLSPEDIPGAIESALTAVAPSNQPS